MKRLFTHCLFLLMFTPVFGQSNLGQKWLKDPFSNLGFAENIGQFEGTPHEQCLFYADYLDYTIFVMKDQLLFGHQIIPEGKDLHEYKKRLERRLPVDPLKWNYFVVQFDGANASAILPKEIKNLTRNFQNPLEPMETLKAKAYNKIVLENIYPNINLILELPESGGLKYSFEVLPGGNISDIQMSYPGTEVETSYFGGLDLMAGFTSFTDRKPISFVSGAEVETSFLVSEDNHVSFDVADYDVSQTLLIDPWLETAMPYTTYNEGYDIGYDDAGNCMILGDDGGQVLLIDNTGAVVWTWDSGSFFGQGDIATNPATGDTYFTTGYTGGDFGDVVRLDDTGTITASIAYPGGVGNPFELWRVRYNTVMDEVVVGSGGGITDQLAILDADLTTVAYFTSLPGATSNTDNVLLEVDLTGDSYYHMPSNSGFGGADGNTLNKVDQADPTSLIYSQETGHDFQETISVNYSISSQNGFNGIAAGEFEIYTYDGNRIVQYDIATGTPTDTVLLGDTEFLQGGIDIDECGNVYVGSNDSILVFDGDMLPIGGYEIPGECYDLLINGDQLYACGNGFATNFEIADGGGSLIMGSTPATCDACNGVAIANPLTCPGTTLESISWVPDVGDTDTITGLCSGWYVATATWTTEEGETIMDIDSVQVLTDDPGVDADLTVVNESCTGACNGEVTVTPTSGDGPYTYEVVGGGSSGTGTIGELCSGTFDVIVTDANGCSSTYTFSVGADTGLGLDTLTTNEPSCFGFTDGSITMQTAGGLGDIEYTWVPENAIGGATFNTLGAGTYTVYAESSDFGCSDSMVIVLGQPDSIYLDLDLIDVACFGDSTGIAVVDTVYDYQGSYDDIVYLWAPNYFGDNGLGVDSSWYMPVGDYTLTINDGNGCSQIVEFEINQPDPLEFGEFGVRPPFCRVFDYQNGGGVVFAAAVGGTPDYTYYWENLNTDDFSVNSTWGGLNPGEYQVTATDANGCTITNTTDQMMLDSLNPIADFDVISDQLNTDLEGTEVVIATFVNQSENFSDTLDPNSDSTFYWNLDYDNINWFLSEDYDEVIDTSYTGEDIYTVCLVAINQNGCSDTLCQDLIVHVRPEFTPPNVFSPGIKDGKNDIFTFEYLSKGMETFNCKIVNRWGVTVSELNSITEGWDGTDFSGDDCPAGVYFYVYEGVSTNGTKFDGQGNVHLIRLEE